MIKVTLWHTPTYFQFWVLGGLDSPSLGAFQLAELERSKFFSLRNLLVVSVVSEFSEIPIQVEFDRFGPDPIVDARWDRIIECPLEVNAGCIEFQSCVGEVFGRLEVQSGSYRLRVCYGGQATFQLSGESQDFYLIQIWPSAFIESHIFKAP